MINDVTHGKQFIQLNHMANYIGTNGRSISTTHAALFLAPFFSAPAVSPASPSSYEEYGRTLLPSTATAKLRAERQTHSNPSGVTTGP